MFFERYNIERRNYRRNQILHLPLQSGVRLVRHIGSVIFFTSDLRYETAFDETSGKKEGSTHCTPDMVWAPSRTDRSNNIALAGHTLFHIFFLDFSRCIGRAGYYFNRTYVMGGLQV